MLNGPYTSDFSANHRQLLRLLLTYRFATTDQLARFTRPDYRSDRSALRQTQRHLVTLEQRGLVIRLERRIGGWQSGSSLGIWSLTTTGHRYLKPSPRRIRPMALSTSFLGHHLAVTETCLVMSEAIRHHPGHKLKLEHEPASHRPYMNPLGIMTAVKPDISATVSSPDYTDYYFIEVDRDTENPARILRTMRRYGQYLATETEQDRLGLFPAIVWIVPTKKRQATLTRHLLKEADLPRDLWIVITLDELPALIKNGPVEFLGREPG